MEYWLSKGKELSITLVPIWTKWELVKMIWALRMARLCKINWSCWRFLEAKASKYTYPSIYPWRATEKRTISLPEKKRKHIYSLYSALCPRGNRLHKSWLLFCMDYGLGIKRYPFQMVSWYKQKLDKKLESDIIHSEEKQYMHSHCIIHGGRNKVSC